ncbi:MAG: hypothetical protein NVS3B14_17400 [Ktedonobacteraceae bacterium]
MRKLRRDPFGATPRMRRRRRKLMMLVSTLLMIGVALVGTAVFIMPRLETHAAAAAPTPNPNCTLIVPDQPLTAQGLATPYKLTATNAADGPCNETNANQSAFVQSAIYDPRTGQFSVYTPLVIDRGTRPAARPVVPTLPAGAIVALWFGFNATNLLLKGAQRDTLAQAHCVNGLGRSLFTQFAYCNAPAFFAAVNQGIVANMVHVPSLGTAKDGQPCPTVRDFSVVDQDQSDNVQTQYLARADGQTAQFSAANRNKLPNAATIANPSDNALLTGFIYPALGCQSWQAPNLTDNGSPVSALALDEIQASVYQRAPVALIPLTDPMTMVADGNNKVPSLAKTNLYRQGADQIPAINEQQASGTSYCMNLLKTGMPRLEMDKPLTIVATTPDPAAANSLFTFLAQRFQASYNMLNCSQLLNIPNPVTTQTDNNGVVTSATFNMQATSMPVPVATAPGGPDCNNVNGTVRVGCNGPTTTRGVTCPSASDKNAHQVKINCRANKRQK